MDELQRIIQQSMTCNLHLTAAQELEASLTPYVTKQLFGPLVEFIPMDQRFATQYYERHGIDLWSGNINSCNPLAIIFTLKGTKQFSIFGQRFI